jgi:hypothetical protein
MIVAYRLSGDFRRAIPDGVLSGPDNRPLIIDGLWGLGFGNNLEPPRPIPSTSRPVPATSGMDCSGG